MDIISSLTIVICFCFIEINCKSIHVHDKFYTDSESKTLNHRHDSKNQVSWIKLKPILRREMLLIRKDAESATVSAESTNEIATNKDSSKNLGLTEKEIYLNATSQFSNNIKTDMLKSNLTSLLGENSDMVRKIASNNTNAQPSILDSSLNRKDFPYNITSPAMNQTGNLVVFFALNENENTADSFNSNETSLMNEGTIIALEDISTTGLELLRDFEKQENSFQTKFSNIQRNLNDEDILSNFGKSFNKHPLGMNSSDDSIRPEITEETHTFTDFSEISTEKSDILNTEQKIEDLFIDEDDRLQVDSNQNNLDLKNKELNSDSHFSSTKSDIKELREISSHNKSNASEIAIITSDETENAKSDPVRTFKTDEITIVSSKKRNNPKCPDPGLCIFWFLAFDTCDEDNHCHGSLVCCMWGCSKMCVDPNVEIH